MAFDQKAYAKFWSALPENKAKRAAYQASPRGKAGRAKSRLKAPRREKERLYDALPERRLAQKRNDLKRKYKLSEGAYWLMLLEQAGKCAICKREETTPHWHNSAKTLAVDHVTDNGAVRVRGLLCGNCNHGIGKFKDNPALLREAANYLEKTQLEPVVA